MVRECARPQNFLGDGKKARVASQRGDFVKGLAHDGRQLGFGKQQAGSERSQGLRFSKSVSNGGVTTNPRCSTVCCHIATSVVRRAHTSEGTPPQRSRRA